MRQTQSGPEGGETPTGPLSHPDGGKLVITGRYVASRVELSSEHLVSRCWVHRRTHSMASKFGEITEDQVALIAVAIGAERIDGIASYSALRDEVPRRHRLSAMDLMQSQTRPREKIWEQKIRN